MAFRLESDGRVAFDLPAQDRADRVAALFGAEAADAMVEVAGERGTLRIAGFACSPAVTRATAAAQALTVNGRPVADPVLKGAVRVAYRDVIAVGRHPMVALWFDLPADELDVNVHPAKAELRFRDVGAVRALVIGSIGRALAGGAGTALPAPRPSLHLVHSRSAPVPYRSVPLPGMAETQLGVRRRAGRAHAAGGRTACRAWGLSPGRTGGAGAGHLRDRGRLGRRAGAGRSARRA